MVKSIPAGQPGQILIRNEQGEWVWMWPHRHVTSAERWFAAVVALLSTTLVLASLALWWSAEWWGQWITQ